MAQSTRYVRLHYGDPRWAELGFAGQAILALLLPLLDTEGCVYVGTTEPWRSAVELLQAPEALALQGMERVLALGMVKHVGSYLVVPGFRESQKAATSEALRKREWRRRKRDLEIRVTDRDMSQNRTSRFVTPTNGYHANLAENAYMSQCPAGHVPGQRPGQCPGTTSGTSSGEPPYEDDPSQIKLPPPEPWVQLIRVWEKVAFNGLPCGDRHSQQGRLVELWDACVARDAAHPLDVFKRAAEGYCEAQRKRGKKPILRFFAQDFAEHADTYKRNGKHTTPQIEALEATKALRDRAKAAGDSDSAARLDLEVARIGKQIADTALGRR